MAMKKVSCLIICIMVCLVYSWSQDSQSSSIVDTFIANFEKGNPSVKLQVLNDAGDLELTGMGPLYLTAIDFIIDNAHLLDMDLVYRKISITAVAAIKGEQYTKAKESLWNLFMADKNTTVRVDILEALADIGVGDSIIIKKINSWLDDQNSVFRTGTIPDMQVIEACVITLGTFGDPSSFPILFRAFIIEYSDSITREVDKALGLIKGDFIALYTSIIRNGFFEEKFRAMERVIANPDFSDADKCQTVDLALNMALYTTLNTVTEKDLARKTRYTAIDFLSRKNWSNSTELVIEHLNRAISELDRGIAGKNYLVDAIKALGNMQTHEAAKRLTLYLDHINSFTENGRTYDEQIVLQVINSLGVLGDAVAMENLLYTKYLNYSDSVKKAANAAIKNLK